MCNRRQAALRSAGLRDCRAARNAYIWAPRNTAQAIVWEHARRNFQLRSDGVLRIVCPVRDGSDVSGIGLFDASEEETRRIMEDDPGVRAGIFTDELHATRGFPGDALS